MHGAHGAAEAEPLVAQEVAPVRSDGVAREHVAGGEDKEVGHTVGFLFVNGKSSHDPSPPRWSRAVCQTFTD